MKDFMLEAILTALFIIAVIWLGLWVSYELGRETLRDEAVVAGHAEYFLDKNYEKQWRWKDLRGE